MQYGCLRTDVIASISSTANPSYVSVEPPTDLGIESTVRLLCRERLADLDELSYFFNLSKEVLIKRLSPCSVTCGTRDVGQDDAETKPESRLSQHDESNHNSLSQ